MLRSVDDSTLTQQITATHCPDSNKKFNLDPFLRVVDNIIHQPTTSGPSPVTNNDTDAELGLVRDDYTLQNGFCVMSEELVYIVNRIYAEISTKSLAGEDVHEITLEVLKLVPGFAWENKVVISLAAYIVKYSEYWLVVQSRKNFSSQLANSLAILMSLPNAMDPQQHDDLRLKFENLTKLIEIVLDLTKTVGDVRKVWRTEDLTTLNEVFATTAYSCIYTTIACFSQITTIQCTLYRNISSSPDDTELCELVDKMKSIQKQIREKIALSYENMAYQNFVKRLFNAQDNDNIKILMALIYANDDQLPLTDGSTKRRVGIDVLRRRNVLLFISDLDVLPEEILILEQMYSESRQHPTRVESQYEVVWLPVVDRSTPWNEAKQSQFETIQNSMPWYSVYHPSLLDPAVIKYIKEVWHFNKKPLLVVLDPQGKVVNPNAIHMMWIWGSLAFPFTSHREESLWREESWRIELLADSIEPLIFNWIAEGKYICLYGGEDIEWIRRFTTTMRTVAQAANIPLELLYVGKSRPGEKVRNNNATIAKENLSHALHEMTLIWYFWTRIESMWHSKMQLGMRLEKDPIMQEMTSMMSFDGSDQGWAVIRSMWHSKMQRETSVNNDDTIMQEIMRMLSFDASDQGWAVSSRGSAEMVKANGDTILQSLTQFDEWKVRIGEVGFMPALVENIKALHTRHQCNRLIFSGSDKIFPEKVFAASAAVRWRNSLCTSVAPTNPTIPCIMFRVRTWLGI